MNLLERKAALSAGAALYTAVAFVTHARSSAFLSDDAYISFRYAVHLAEGLGLVFNAGERVEGYSNFLWVLILAAGHRFGIPPEASSPVLGMLCGLAVLLLLPCLFAQGPELRRIYGEPWAWVPSLSLALHPSFTAWSTGGLETMFFAFLLLAGTVRWMAERQEPARRPWLSAVLFAAAAWTRPEGNLFMTCVGLVVLYDVLKGRVPLRRALLWGTPFLVLVAGHLLWRYGYYQSWWPNTANIKVGWNVEQGERYLAYYFGRYRQAWLLLCVPFAWLLRPSAQVALATFWTAFYGSYVVAIGGDFLEFRMLIPILPWLFFLIVQGGWALFALRPAFRIVAALVAWLPISCSLVVPSYELKPVQGIESVKLIHFYGKERGDQGRRVRRLVEDGLLPADIGLATGGAGALPYYSGLKVLDYRGLNDTWVAQNGWVTQGKVGHQKMAPLSYLKLRDVAVVNTQIKLIFEAGESREYFLDEQRKDNAYYHRNYDRALEKQGRPADPGLLLRAECYRLPDGRALIFGSNMDPSRLDALLPRLSRCPETLLSSSLETGAGF